MGAGGQYTIRVHGVLDDAQIRAQLASLGKQSGAIMGGGKKGKTNGAFGAIGKDATKAQKQVKGLNTAIDTTNKKIKQAPKIAGGYTHIGKGAQQSAKDVKKFGSTTLDVTKKVVQFGAVTAVIRGVTSGIGSMVQQTFELDGALTEFKKVSDLSGKGLEKYTEQAYKLGGTVAKTGQEMIEAATEFRKAGYNDQDAMQLGRIASMYQNVADQELSAGEAANFITSQMKAYNIEAKDAEHIIDGVNEVSNNFAVSSADIATNIGKASAALAQGNITYEESIGLMTAITEITRNGSTAARGLVSIQSRFNQITDETSSTGKKLTAWYEKHNIAIKDQNGNLKSFFEVGKDVSKIWNQLSKDEQMYYLNTQAGANQSRNLAALMRNYGTAVQAAETALHSEGSATRENARYMDSLQGKLKELQSAWSRFSNAIVKSDAVKGVLGGLTKALNFMASDGGQALIKVSAGIVGIVGAAKLLNKIPSGVGKVSGAFKNLGKTIGKSAGGATKATGLFRGLAGVFSGGAVSWGILGAAGVVFGLYKLHTYLKEKYDPENQYKKTKEDLEALQKELKGVQEEKKELQKKVENGTATDSEERRLNLLKRQEASLKRQIELQSQLERKAYAKKETGATKGVTKTDAYKKAYNKRMETPGMQPEMARKLAAQDIGATDKLASKTIEYKDALGKLSTATKTQSELQEKYNKAVKDGDDGKAAQYAKELEKADDGVAEAQKKLGDTFGDLRKKRDEWAKRFGSEDKMPEHMRESYKEADKLLDAFDDLQSTGSFEKLKGDGLKRVMNDFKDLGDTMGITLNEAGEINSIDFGTFTTQMENAGFSADETREALALISQENPTARVNIDGIDVSAQNLDLVLDYLDKVNGNDPNATVEVNGTDVAVSDIESVEQLLSMVHGETATPGVELEGAEEAQQKLDELLGDLSPTDKQTIMTTIGVEGAVDTKDEIEAVEKALKEYDGTDWKAILDANTKPADKNIKKTEKNAKRYSKKQYKAKFNADTKNANKNIKKTDKSGKKYSKQKYTSKLDSDPSGAEKGTETATKSVETFSGKEAIAYLREHGGEAVKATVDDVGNTILTMPDGKTVTITETGAKGGEKNVSGLNKVIKQTKGKSVNVNASTSGKGGITSLQQAINSVKGKTVTVTVNYKKNGNPGKAKGGIAKNTGLTEVNEEGWEFIRDAKTGALRIAGGGKRTVTLLGKGDAVYTHAESKRMMSQEDDIHISQHASGSSASKKKKAKKKAQEKYNKAYEKRKNSYENAVDKLEYTAGMEHWSDKGLADEIKKKYDQHIKALKKWNKGKYVKKLRKKGAKVKNSFGTDLYREAKLGVEEAAHDIRIKNIENQIESFGFGGGGDDRISASDVSKQESSLATMRKKNQISAEEYQDYLKEIRQAYIENGMKLVASGKKTYKDMRADLDSYAKNGKITWAEYYDYLEELLEKQLENEQKALEKRQKTNEETYSLAVAWIDRAIEIKEKEKEQLDEQNQLIELQSNLEKARSQRVKVYRQGQGFVYEQDTEAIREATQALQDYKKEQDSPELQQLKRIKEILEGAEVDAEIANLEARLGKSFEQLFGGLGTDEIAWTNWAQASLSEKFGIENILEEMEELEGWEAIQNFFKGANATISEAQLNSYINNVKNRFATGTLNAPAGLTRVAENGYEIALLGRGDAVMPHNISENLMQWGQYSPLEVMQAGGATTTQSFNFDKLILPNVTNADQFIRELNNLPNKAIQSAWSRGA